MKPGALLPEPYGEMGLLCPYIALVRFKKVLPARLVIAGRNALGVGR